MKSKIKNLLKSFTLILVITFISFSCVGCEKNAEHNDNYIDLTACSSTMVYSQVYDMVENPNNYLGKKVKVKGNCAITSNKMGKLYYSIVIQDATACCSQYLEFELSDNSYPNNDDFVTVEGIFQTYNEGDYSYCVLKSAKII